LPGRATFVKSTKTGTTRIISLPPIALSMLKEYEEWQTKVKQDLGDLWHNCNAMFTVLDRSPIFPSTISKWFLNFIRRHNESIMMDETIPKEVKQEYLLREVIFNGLGHTSATILINQNMGSSAVSKRLGHSRTSTTMDIYAHALQSAHMVAADKFENHFNKKSPEDEN